MEKETIMDRFQGKQRKRCVGFGRKSFSEKLDEILLDWAKNADKQTN